MLKLRKVKHLLIALYILVYNVSASINSGMRAEFFEARPDVFSTIVLISALAAGSAVSHSLAKRSGATIYIFGIEFDYSPTPIAAKLSLLTLIAETIHSFIYRHDFGLVIFLSFVTLGLYLGWSFFRKK